MPQAVVVALISLSGVLVSVAISVLAGRWQVNVASARLLAETRNAFGSRIYEKRLELYPEYYSHVSSFIKAINFGEVTKPGLTALLEAMQDWDSRNAIYLGPAAHQTCSKVRHKLFALTQESEEVIRARFEAGEERLLLKRDLQRVELALKEELGVFLFRSPVDVASDARFETYNEAHGSIWRV
jgi:hypothetical protein